MRVISFIFVFYCCTLIINAGCTKRIISSGGRVWYSPYNERQPFQQDNTNNINEFDNQIFVRDISSVNKTDIGRQQQNNQIAVVGSRDKELEQAVNNSFYDNQKIVQPVPSQPVVVQPKQVDLTANDKIKKNQQVNSGNVVLTPPTCCTKSCNEPVVKQIKEEEPKKVLSYKIQCGNYVNKMKAQEIANKLKKNNINDVYIDNSGTAYRIFAGKFNDKNTGQELFKKIKDLGYDDVFWVYQ